MLVKLKAAFSSIKTNVSKAYTAIEPALIWAGNAFIVVLNILAKLSSQLGLIIGIAIGYKLAPIIKILSPFIKLFLNIAAIPLRILGWL